MLDGACFAQAAEGAGCFLNGEVMMQCGKEFS